MKLDTLEKILVSLGVEVDEFFHLVRSFTSVLKPPESAVRRRVDEAVAKLAISIMQFQEAIGAAALAGSARPEGTGGTDSLAAAGDIGGGWTLQRR